jgi:hypothetical protein
VRATQAFGDELDFKFKTALAHEIDRDEPVWIQVFRRHRLSARRRFWFLRERKPADLFAITGRRVLWMTDRYRENYSPYGSMVRSAPIEELYDVAGEAGADGTLLPVTFRSGHAWRIPFDLDPVEMRAVHEAQSALPDR